jgi:hypothetical protein
MPMLRASVAAKLMRIEITLYSFCVWT